MLHHADAHDVMKIENCLDDSRSFADAYSEFVRMSTKRKKSFVYVVKNSRKRLAEVMHVVPTFSITT